MECEKEERKRKINKRWGRTITSARKKRKTEKGKAQYRSRLIQKKDSFSLNSGFLTPFVLIDFRLMCLPLDAC